LKGLINRRLKGGTPLGLLSRYSENTCKEQDVEHAKNGNKEAFSRLIMKNEKSMYRIAKSILKNDEDCADAIQEAIIKAYKGIHKLKNTEFFKTWLIKIIINESSRLLRSKNRLVSVNEIYYICEDNQLTEFDRNEIEVRHAVDSLDSDLKVVTVLHYYEDLSVKRMAEILAIPEGTIKSRLSRARSVLYNALELKEEI